LRLAWIQIRSQIAQLGIAIVVIALGVALSAGMLLANAALRQSFETSTDALAGRADLVVTSLSGGTIDQQILDQVRAIDRVDAAAPLLIGDGFLNGAEALRVRIVGVDMLDDETLRVYRANPSGQTSIQDPLIFLNQPRSVIAPRRLLKLRNIDLGSEVAVQT